MEIPSLAQFNLGVALPAITLAFGTMVVLLVDIFLPEERSRFWTPFLALSGITASFIMTLFNYSPEQAEAFGGMFVADSLTAFLNMLVLGTAFLSILLSTDYLKRTNIEHGEYYSLLLLATAGVMFMIGSNDLIMIFISLELLSIPLYVLAAFRSTDNKDLNMAARSEESGIKYLIMGALASAFLVYGFALIYGATGTTSLPAIFAAVTDIMAVQQGTATFLLLVGSGLAVVGLGFKVAAVPFHMWTPDVYEGAPTPVTTYMSVAAKIGGFAALLRLLVVGLPTFVVIEGDPVIWQNVIQVLAILTLIVGNVIAISQTNIKRLLAYSSIAHAGYLLMALAAAGSASVGNSAVQAMLVYLMAYMFTNIGAFAVALAIEKADGSGTDLEDLVGLGRSQPLLAAAMAIFMLSLTGIPLTAGFIGKYLVFASVVQAGMIPLAIVGVLTSVVSAFYYVRVIVNMYLRDDAEGDAAEGATPPVQWAVYASLAATLIIGIFAPLATNLASMVQLIS